jgi:hypothetical protein
MSYFFSNHVFDKGELKRLIHWFLITQGPAKTLNMVDRLKGLGFHYATEAGISLGIEDLKIPPIKPRLLRNAEEEAQQNEMRFARGKITAVERSQKVIDIWNTTSELLKEEVVHHFRRTDLLNPVYMMAFSGARGNMSQVRQLVGMRGLMSDPQGEIIDLPIKSNFREGLTVTEYIISCYGARKGLVDTALKTANSGYLTRRLVDVAQAVIVNEVDCNTSEGIVMTDLLDGNKVLISRERRLVGRVLVQLIQDPKTGWLVGLKNQDISSYLAKKLNTLASTPITVRSPLTCQTSRHVCQLCYGWSLASGQLVELGEAIGIIAAQSIGEPGTQLTMRTFHTGGVFSGEVVERVYAPHPGTLWYEAEDTATKIRTVFGQEALYFSEKVEVRIEQNETHQTKLSFPPYTLFFTKSNTKVYSKQMIAEYSSVEQILKKSEDSDGVITVKEVVSDMEGQVYFHFFSKQGKWIKKQSKNRRAKGNGLVWVLAGKIMDSSVFNQPLGRNGDFIDPPPLESSLAPPLVGAVEDTRFSSSFFDSTVLSDGFLYKKSSLGLAHHGGLLWLPAVTQKFYFPAEFGYLLETIHESNYSPMPNELHWNHSSFSPLLKRLSTGNQLNALKRSFSSRRLHPATQLDLHLQKKFTFPHAYLKGGYDMYEHMSHFVETFPAWFYWPKKKTKPLGLKQMKKQFLKHYAISPPYQTLTDNIQFNESIFSKWYPSFNMFRFQKLISLRPDCSVRPSYKQQIHSSLFVESGTPLLYSFKKGVPSKKVNPLPFFQEKKADFNEFVRIHENGQLLVKQKENQVRFRLNQQKPWVKTGSFVLKGDSLAQGVKATHSGRVIQKTKTYLTLRTGRPYRTSNSSPIVVSHGSLVLQGKTLFNLVYKKAKTEDIVQGLPKIEELLEARRTKDLQPILNNPHDRLKKQFHEYKAVFDTETAARKSLLDIQQFLVNGVQGVYQSQGVDISDKHIEIIVKQMTSKVFIEDSGQTPFLYGDLVDFYHLKKINEEMATRGRKLAKYEPIILGITKASLKAESFISAASFQETTRVLTQAAIQGKLDSFVGLKENVIIGQLIPAGTGFLRTKPPVGFTSTLTLFPSYASRFLSDGYSLP